MHKKTFEDIYLTAQEVHTFVSNQVESYLGFEAEFWPRQLNKKS